jgi:hypothetical protein
MILGSWKVTWRFSYPGAPSNTGTEYLLFDDEHQYIRSSTQLGNWVVEGEEIVGRHGVYTDRFRLVSPQQIIGVRLRSGQPYMQGVGVRYTRD